MQQGASQMHTRQHRIGVKPTARQPQRALFTCAIAGLLSSLLALSAARAADGNELPPVDLMDMSLEALMNIEVTSVSKRPQKKSETAAAIYVITSEELRRWGVTNIPDALRRVPGLQVARIDAGKWAITARGFNSRFANKLLVMIDGRSVYTPLFAGVYWEANDVMLEDVERIEVIRGPGGTLWGANAVNGVINIITRSAADTQGTLTSAAAGNEEHGMVSVRYGGRTADQKNYRVYGKFHAVDSGEAIATGMFPPVAHDDSQLLQGGFRADWGKGTADSFTVQGDVYHVRAGQELLIATSANPLVEDARHKGGNLLSRWTHKSGPASNYTVQTYLDHVGLDSGVLFEDRNTLDLDFQHHFQAAESHDLIWGLNFRTIQDDTDPTRIFWLDPSRRTVNLYSAFVQDEIALFEGRANLTLGSKFEHNDFTGFELQPNARLTWLTDSGNTIWGSLSRAVRTPARGEHDVVLAVIPPAPAPPPLTIFGDDRFASETLIAYELGYRCSVSRRISMDITAFYNVYEKLRTVDVYTPVPPLEAVFGNNLEGNTQGLEIDARWKVNDRLTVNANYTRLDIDLDLVNNSMDTLAQSAEDASPAHQGNLWLAADIENNLQLDAGLRYVGHIHTPGMPADMPAYLAFDARIGWNPRPGLELSMTGQNLFDSAHAEFSPDFIYSLPTEVERSIYGKILLKF